MPHPEDPSPPTSPHSARRRRAPRRTDRGLTTLEWLLIVAAVAGLAALAVVLVQNVVDDTAEQISGSSARLTAADVAASEISAEARKSDSNNDGTFTAADTEFADADAASAKLADYRGRCERLRITYGDALDNAEPDQQVQWHVGDPTDANFKKNGDSITVGKETTNSYQTPACVIYDA